MSALHVAPCPHITAKQADKISFKARILFSEKNDLVNTSNPRQDSPQSLFLHANNPGLANRVRTCPGPAPPANP